MGATPAKAGNGRAGRGLRRLLLGLTTLALFLLAVIAVNQEQVSIRFLAWRTPEWSLFWWLLIAFSAGVLIGALAMLPARTKSAWESRRLRKQIRQARSEQEPAQV